MTDKEINELARKYGQAKGNGKSSIVREYNTGLMTEALRWLLRDHCIVRKSEVVEWVETVAEFMPSSNLQFMLKCGAKNLFGTEIFNNNNEEK